MKKFFAMYMAMMVAVSITACGSNGSNSSVDGGNTGNTGGTGFPIKQITLVCPLGAGGASDTISRLYAAALEQETGVPVMVENKPGAGAGIGLEAIASSKPDGYTIGYIPAEVTTVKAMGNADVTPENYIFLGSAMKIRTVIAVPADSKWNSLEEFITDAKANPGAITIGTAGVGNAYELGLLQFMKSSGIELNIVNFSDGTAAAITAMLGGNVDACTAGTSEAKSYAESGQFKLLCHLSSERSPIFPDVPTATELGYACDGHSWGAFGVPVGTPDDVVQMLTDATKKALNSDSIKEVLSERGFDEYYVAGSEFQTIAEEMFVTNSGIIEEFGLSAN